MKAVIVSQGTDASALTLQTVDKPVVGDGQVQIRVAGAGLNRADILQRQGKYNPPTDAPDVLGLEVSGIIKDVGPGVQGFAVGDRVCALLAGGGYQTYAVADAGLCLKVPDEVDLLDASGLPEALFTVYANVYDIGGLQKGQRVLFHGGNSGISSIGIQMACATGAKVFATARGADNVAFAEKLGATVVNTESGSFADEVLAQTQGKGVNVILDMVGGDYVAQNLACLAMDGVVTNIATAQGPKVEISFRHIMAKRARLSGSFLRARPLAEKERLAMEIKEHIWPFVASGQIAPVTDRIFPAAKAAAAHAYFEEGQHKGKVLLDFRDS